MRFITSIWNFFSTSTYASWPLVCTLSLACLLLFGLLVVPNPNPQFNNVPPLFKEGTSANGDQQAEKNDNPKIKTRDLPVRVLGMESGGLIEDEPDDEERATQLQRQRVAANILIRSGYLASADITVSTCGKPPPRISYFLNVDPFVYECVDLTGGENADQESTEQSEAEAKLRDTAGKLAIVAVAVEKFHRTALHRRVEWAYAHTFLSLVGRLPDLSLGPAQIRPSRIRDISKQVAQKKGPYTDLNNVAHSQDVGIAEALSNECRSLKLAAAIMNYYLNKASECTDKNDNVSANKPHCPDEDYNTFAARNYVGQRRTTSATLDYAPIVASIVGSLDQREDVCPEEEVETPEPPLAAAPSKEPAQDVQQESRSTHQQKTTDTNRSPNYANIPSTKRGKKQGHSGNGDKEHVPGKSEKLH